MQSVRGFIKSRHEFQLILEAFRQHMSTVQGGGPSFAATIAGECVGQFSDGELYSALPDAGKKKILCTLKATLKQQALAMVDVRVLDHFIVANNAIVSFAEKGLL